LNSKHPHFIEVKVEKGADKGLGKPILTIEEIINLFATLTYVICVQIICVEEDVQLEAHILNLIRRQA